MIKLPKPYLSWSQCRVWMENRQAYRDRYYRGLTEKTSKYMIFGSEVAKGLETGELKIPALVQYPKQEYQLNVEVDGIPVFGYIDQYDPEKIKFREIKTGMPKPDGSPRWTDKEVKAHGQLDMYSLLLQIKHGTVDEECHLDWLKTRNKVKTLTDAFGNELTARSSELELSGEVESFARIITQDERDAMRRLIVKTATEIETDYAVFLELSKERSQLPLE